MITANNGHDEDVVDVFDDGRRIERSILTLNIVWSVIIHRLSLLRYSSTHLWLFVYEPLPQTVTKAIDFHSINICLNLWNTCERIKYFKHLFFKFYRHQCTRTLSFKKLILHTQLPAKTINMNEFVLFFFSFTSFALCLFFLSAYTKLLCLNFFFFYLLVIQNHYCCCFFEIQLHGLFSTLYSGQ